MKFIAGGKPGDDVLDLFLSDEIRQLLAEARDDYDLVLLDAPPVEAMTEARVAASLADATLLCVRWRSTQTKTLLHALELLHDAHAKIIGTVLTGSIRTCIFAPATLMRGYITAATGRISGGSRVWRSVFWSPAGPAMWAATWLRACWTAVTPSP